MLFHIHTCDLKWVAAIYEKSCGQSSTEQATEIKSSRDTWSKRQKPYVGGGVTGTIVYVANRQKESIFGTVALRAYSDFKDKQHSSELRAQAWAVGEDPTAACMTGSCLHSSPHPPESDAPGCAESDWDSAAGNCHPLPGPAAGEKRAGGISFFYKPEQKSRCWWSQFHFWHNTFFFFDTPDKCPFVSFNKNKPNCSMQWF